MVQIPEYVAKETLDTDRRGMPQPELVSGSAGLALVGNALEQFGAHLSQRAKETSATKGNYAYEEAAAEAELNKHTYMQTAPADGTGVHDNLQKITADAFAKHRKDVPADKLDEYDARTRIYNNRSSIDSSDKQYSLSKTYNTNKLKDIAGNYITQLRNDPSQYDTVKKLIDGYVDDQPMTPADKAILKAQMYESMAEAQYDGLRKTDPKGTRLKLGGTSSVKAGKTLPIVTGSAAEIKALGRQPLMMAGTNPDVLNKWMHVQGAVGFQAPIVSAHRPKAINFKAKGAKGSQHIPGNAIDVNVRGLSHQQILALIHAGSQAGFGGIKLYGENTIHFDVGPKRTWGITVGWAQPAIQAHLDGKLGAAPIITGGTGAREPGYGEPSKRPLPKVEAGETSSSFVHTAASDLMESENAPLMSASDDEQIMPYDDSKKGSATKKYRAGFGSDEYTTADGKVHKVVEGQPITVGDAKRDVVRRAKEFADVAKKDVGEEAWNKLGNGAKRALTSLAYHHGSLRNLTSIKEAARSGDNEALAQAIESMSDPRFRDRRAREAAIVRNDTAVRIEPAGGPAETSDIGGALGGPEVDPAFANMPYEWRQKKLDELDADEKQYAKERQQEAKAYIEKIEADALAGYEANGGYTGDEPTEELYMTADPSNYQDKWVEYQVKREVAKTVYNIATMDVSEARQYRKAYKDAIPDGAYASIAFRAYKDIDKAVTANEARFDNKIEEQRRRTKAQERGFIRPDEYGMDKMDNAMTEVEKQIKDKHEFEMKRIGQLVEERRAQREKGIVSPGTGRTDETNLQLGLDEAKSRVEFYAKKHVGTVEDILTSVETSNSLTDEQLKNFPDQADFVIADPVNGIKNWMDFMERYSGAMRTNHLISMSDRDIYRQQEQLYKAAKTKVANDTYTAFKLAGDKVMENRRKDPLGFAKKYYTNVQTAWNDSEANPNDNELKKKAIALTLEAQKSWGLEDEELAIVPQHEAELIAGHFKDPERSKNTQGLMGELLGVLENVPLKDGKPDKQAQIIIMAQLEKAGVSSMYEPAVDAYVDGRNKAAVTNLFEAARFKTFEDEEEGVTVQALGDAVATEANERGIDTYYGVMVGSTANVDRYNAAVKLLTKAAQIRMIRGEEQSDAITHAITDLLGSKAPYEETLDSGAKVNIMDVPSGSDVEVRRGFNTASEEIKKTLTDRIAQVELRGNDVSRIQLPVIGMAEKGNIDLDKRIPVKITQKMIDTYGDIGNVGDVMTEHSFSFPYQGQEVLVPRMIEGQLFTEEQAKQHFVDTGQHLGKFESTEAADAYAEALHMRQAMAYGVNFVQTEAYKKKLGNLIDSYFRESVWVEKGGGYALYNNTSMMFIEDQLTGQPMILSKEAIQEMGAKPPFTSPEEMLLPPDLRFR